MIIAFILLTLLVFVLFLCVLGIDQKQRLLAQAVIEGLEEIKGLMVQAKPPPRKGFPEIKKEMEEYFAGMEEVVKGLKNIRGRSGKVTDFRKK